MAAIFLILKNALCMSLAGSLAFLLLTAALPLTKRLFSSRWHCRSLALALAFFLVPAGFLPIGAVISMVLPILPFMGHSGFPDVWDNLSASEFSGTTAQQAGVIHAESFDPTLILPLLAGIWALVAMLLLVRKSVRLLRFGKAIADTASPVDDPALLGVFTSIKKGMGISGQIGLLYNPCVATPMLVGLFRPKLVLPEISLSRRETAFILRHELTHLKNRDLLVKTVAAFVCALHWFNPCAHLLARRLDSFLELACDADVVRDMDFEQRKAYGAAILSVLERVSGVDRGLYAGLCENKRNMKRRLINMLNEKKSGKTASVLSVLALAAVCIAGLTMSAYAYNAVPEATPVAEPMTGAVTEPVTGAAPANTSPGAPAGGTQYAVRLEVPLPEIDEDVLFRARINDELVAEATINPAEYGSKYWSPTIYTDESGEFTVKVYINKKLYQNIMVEAAGSGTPKTTDASAPASFVWPTDGGWVSTGLNGYRGHTGMDIVVPEGTPIFAAASGVVVAAKNTNVGYGKYIIIDHGGGYQTLYAQNGSLSVEEGDTVEQGQTIAAAGRSGHATGVHLHFEIRKDERIKDPALYVNEKNLPMELPKD